MSESDVPEAARPPPALDLAAQMRAAAEKLRSVVQEQMKHALDYDEASVRWLDSYIERARLSAAGEQWRKNLIDLSAAFLGECSIARLGGQWALHEGRVCVLFNDNNVIFPHHKVAKQFDNGAEAGDSILGFYQANISLFKALAPKALTPGQQRLLEFAGDSKHRIFVRQTATEASPRWALVAQVHNGFVELYAPPGQTYTVSLALSDVRCFYVCTPVLNVLHTEWINKSEWDTLPPSILAQLKSRLATDTTLTLDRLESGQHFIEITYGPSDKPADESHSYYSTSLKNISSRKIQITMFGGYRATPTSWQLASVTGDFYTDDDFKDWYGQKTQWLLPGEAVCDNANWGRPPVLWAYFGITDTGEAFVAGKVLE